MAEQTPSGVESPEEKELADRGEELVTSEMPTQQLRGELMKWLEEAKPFTLAGGKDRGIGHVHRVVVAWLNNNV